MTRFGTDPDDNVVQSLFGVKARAKTYCEAEGVNVKTADHLTDDQIRELNEQKPEEVIRSSFSASWSTPAGVDTKVWIDGDLVAAAASISWTELWEEEPNTPVLGSLSLFLFHNLATKILLKKLKYDKGFDIKVQSCDEFGNLYSQTIEGVEFTGKSTNIGADDLFMEHSFDFQAENVTDVKLDGPIIRKEVEELVNPEKKEEIPKKEKKNESKPARSSVSPSKRDSDSGADNCVSGST